MANLKYKVLMLFQCVASAIKDWRIACKGQKEQFELLQIAHRLEKGLLLENPRPLWGWEKANRLVDLIILVDDAFFKETGSSVLNAFLKSKEKSIFKEDRDKCENFKKEHLIGQNYEKGGATKYRYEAFSKVEVGTIEKLFSTRHSVRSFTEDIVPESSLIKAIDLALRCPSACNRQPFHVYVINKETKEKLGNSEGYSGSQFLFVTGDIRAFALGEFNDWIVSPSIFVGYLTLALHLYGIGSCVIRKDLVCDTQFNKAVKAVCKIPNEEKLILELAVGYYKTENLVPFSNRHKGSEIVTFIS